MKTKIKIIFLVLMLCSIACATSQKASAQGGSVSYQVFYDELSPYGSWVQYPDYGYVWVPDVAPGFTPYATNGYWVYTDYGWTWVSNYTWGWAPFHYGRWYTDAYYGSIWIPDDEWGPGWVTWRRSEGYYGWAPIGPVSAVYGNGYNVPYNQWTFVRNGNFGRTNIYNYYVSNTNNVTIINNSTIINNNHVDKTHSVTYNAGPDRSEVEKRAGKAFTPYAIKASNKPGQNLSNNQLQIYRPQVKKDFSGQKPVPSKVASLKDVKTVSQRTSGTPAQKGNQPMDQKSMQMKSNGQMTKQQPVQTKPSGQTTKQQPVQTKPAGQQNKQQPVQTKPAGQQNKQQPVQTKPAGQQNKQQPVQTKPTGQQNKQQPVQTKPAGQQNKQQPVQTKPAGQPTKQNPVQHQQNKPTQNKEGENHPH